MSESTLALAYADLKAAAGLFLGYGRGVSKGDATWNTRQSSILDEIVKSGLRQFYFPAPVDKGGVSHEWSFLRPSAELLLPSGTQSLALPDDFGGFDGDIFPTQDSGTATNLPLQLGTMGTIRSLRGQFPTSTGRPVQAAVDAIKGANLNSGQRWNLEIYPLSDGEYTLLCSYHIHPDALTGDRPYAYGGPQHAETIQMSIIAAAALYLDDQADTRKMAFMERLAVSVSQDRKMKPQNLGYNGDRSNSLYGQRLNREDLYRGRITVYGNTV